MKGIKSDEIIPIDLRRYKMDKDTEIKFLRAVFVGFMSMLKDTEYEKEGNLMIAREARKLYGKRLK